MAQGDGTHDQDEVDTLIDIAQEALEAMDRARANRVRTIDEALHLVQDLVDYGEALNRDCDSLRRNNGNLSSRLEATERREEEARGRTAEVEREASRVHVSLLDTENRLKNREDAYDLLLEQHTRLTGAFRNLITALGDKARDLQDEDQRLSTARALARSLALFGQAREDEGTVIDVVPRGGPQAIGFEAQRRLPQASTAPDDQRRRPDVRLSANES